MKEEAASPDSGKREQLEPQTEAVRIQA